MQMWVHFNLLCGREAQLRLHKVFRYHIKAWEKQGLVKGAVLTYHFHVPTVPTDSLYVCLDIPAMKTPQERSIELSSEVVEGIPSELLNNIKQICSQNQIKLQIRDYELALEHSKASRLYRNAPVEEILRFASVGTMIALDILNQTDTGERPWTSDRELGNFIVSRLKDELGDSYFWLREGFHFVCNPLRFSHSQENHLWLSLLL